MITVFASVQVEESHVEDFLREFVKVAKATRQESGNYRYDIYQNIDDPTLIHFHEEFEDEAALTAHGQSVHFSRFFETVKPWLLEGPTGVRTQKLSI